MRKKRPCSECRRWFLPDPRVGSRQKTCGRPECQAARHSRKRTEWRARNPDYDRARRWQAKLDEAGRSKVILPARSQPPRGVPWEVVGEVLGPLPGVMAAEMAGLVARQVQEEMRSQVVVLHEEFRRLRHPGAREEMRSQAPEITGESRRLAQGGAQEEMEARGRPP